MADVNEVEVKSEVESVKPVPAPVAEYLAHLAVERDQVPTDLTNTLAVLDKEIAKVTASTQENGDGGSTEAEYLDIMSTDAFKLTRKILLPAQGEGPKINYVGRILGPKGITLKNLSLKYRCKLAVFGLGSMREDKQKEALESGDPKYAHLSEPLHVHISLLGQPASCYRRLSDLIYEITPFLMPELDENIRQQQYYEAGMVAPAYTGGRGRAQQGPQGGGWGQGYQAPAQNFANDGGYAEYQAPGGRGRGGRGGGKAPRGGMAAGYGYAPY